MIIIINLGTLVTLNLFSPYVILILTLIVSLVKVHVVLRNANMVV